jgi:hypothetical protein
VSELVAGTATSIEDFRDRLIRAIENLRGSRPSTSAPAGKVAQPA